MSTNPNSHPPAVTARVRTGMRPVGIRGKSDSRGGMFAAGIAVLK